MATQIVDDPLTNVKIPAAGRRRRKLPPMDPRRAPEDVVAGSLNEPAGSQVATDLALADPTPPLKTATGVTAGVAVIRAALRTMPATPGVYRMLDRKGDALYVGKARSLRSRVQNYTHPAALSNRLRRMVAETAAMEIVVDPYRGRSAAARMQSDQAADAALQCSAARRQIVSADPSDRRSRLSATDQISRRARARVAAISARSPRRGRSIAPW